MTKVMVSAHPSSIQECIKQISTGLKAIDEAQKREILAEISSHLNERVAELTMNGNPNPVEEAISSLGDPAELASQFVAEARAQRGIRSYAPWTLLRRAGRIARTGSKGFFIFLIGLTGYGFTLGAALAAVLKPFIPEMGFWVGSFGVVWGVKPDGAPGRELLGPYFIYASIALSFVFGSFTTLWLRRLTSKIPFFGKWPTGR